jgi:hypothetical protein
MVICMLIYVIDIDISSAASAVESLLSLDVDFIGDQP